MPGGRHTSTADVDKGEFCGEREICTMLALCGWEGGQEAPQGLQAVKQLSRVSPGRQAGRQAGGRDGHTGLGIVSHAWSARLLSPYHC